MSATFAEVLYFTRYLFDPRMWHPDGCLYEYFTPGSVVYYQGYRAYIVRCAPPDHITIRYEDKHPYDVPVGIPTYEDLHVESAIGRLHLFADYENTDHLGPWRDEPTAYQVLEQSNEDYRRPALTAAAEWDVGTPTYSM